MIPCSSFPIRAARRRPVRRPLTARAIAAIAAVALSLAVLPGCYGKFNVTRHVHGWNGTIGNPWKVEGVFLLLVLLPVYPLATVSDAFIFNLIEFWTGVNPIIPAGGGEVAVAPAPGPGAGRAAKVRRIPGGPDGVERLEVTIEDARGASRRLLIDVPLAPGVADGAEQDGAAVVRTPEGEIVGTARIIRGEDGRPRLVAAGAVPRRPVRPAPGRRSDG